MTTDRSELEAWKARVAESQRREARPGRNEPCTCGSGKKYKQCHMKADRETDNARRAEEDAAQYLRRDLLKFARDERFATAVAEGIGQYWNGFYTVDSAEEMSQAESMRFFDWLAFDYALPGEDGATRLIEVYRDERGPELSTPQRKVLDAWIAAPPSIALELLEADGQTLYLRDVVTGDLAVAYEPGGVGGVSEGDVLLARLVPVGERLTFSGSVAYIPADEVLDLPAQLAAAREAYAVEHAEADLATFLRAHAHLPVHHALAQAEAQGRPPVARLDETRRLTAAEKAARRLRRLQG